MRGEQARPYADMPTLGWCPTHRRPCPAAAKRQSQPVNPARPRPYTGFRFRSSSVPGSASHEDGRTAGRLPWRSVRTGIPPSAFRILQRILVKGRQGCAQARPVGPPVPAAAGYPRSAWRFGGCVKPGPWHGPRPRPGSPDLRGGLGVALEAGPWHRGVRVTVGTADRRGGLGCCGRWPACGVSAGVDGSVGCRCRWMGRGPAGVVPARRSS